MSPDWKKKCGGCGNFFIKSEISSTFGGFKCNECLKKQTINKQGTLLIPKFLRKKYDVLGPARVMLEERSDGILIKKLEAKSEENNND